jgi:hypothetical protein
VSKPPTASGEPLNAVTPPRSINLVSIALIAEAVAWLGAALTLRTSTSQFLELISKSYKSSSKTDKAHGKYVLTVGKKKEYFSDWHEQKLYDHIKQSLTDARHGMILRAAIFGLALLLLAWMLRRTRGASPARWSIVILSVLVGAPMSILSVGSGLPAGFSVANVAIGVTSIASIALLFTPQSRGYFRACRDAVAATLPPRPARSGGLFGSKRPAQETPKVAPKERVEDEPEEAPARPSLEKKRHDAESVAKGASLARSRAKAAAKSRRMEE